LGSLTFSPERGQTSGGSVGKASTVGTFVGVGTRVGVEEVEVEVEMEVEVEVEVGVAVDCS
jgi:hypothetical protein